MIRLMLLVPMAATLLACGLVARSDDPVAGVVETPAAPTEEPAAQLYELPPAATGVLPPPSVASETLIPLYAGDSLIEEKIIENPVVVRATLTSFSSDTIVYDNKYHVMLQFNINVSEYLKGTGPSSIVALWVDGRPYDTIDKANDAKAIVLMERDAQWDDREAIIFLFDGLGGLSSLLPAYPQFAGYYLLALGDPYSDDRYSLHSKRYRAWLPAATSTSSTGDGQEFLLDVPPPTETITLGDLKRKITEVAAELDGGDGSEKYRECVLEKYRYIRNQRNWPGERGNPYGVWDLDYSRASGQPAGTVLDQHEAYGVYPDTKITLWFEGSGASLFDIADGDSTVSDRDGDGENDQIKYDEMVRLARPIPAGEYRFDLKEA